MKEQEEHMLYIHEHLPLPLEDRYQQTLKCMKSNVKKIYL